MGCTDGDSQKTRLETTGKEYDHEAEETHRYAQVEESPAKAQITFRQDEESSESPDS